MVLSSLAGFLSSSPSRKQNGCFSMADPFVIPLEISLSMADPFVWVLFIYFF
jgi:hypothetical protein